MGHQLQLNTTPQCFTSVINIVGGMDGSLVMVAPVEMAQILERFGRPVVDLFLSRGNAHCPLSFSITDHNATLGTDALADLWPLILIIKHCATHLKCALALGLNICCDKGIIPAHSCHQEHIRHMVQHIKSWMDEKKMYVMIH